MSRPISPVMKESAQPQKYSIEDVRAVLTLLVVQSGQLDGDNINYIR